MARPQEIDRMQELADFLKANPHVDEVTKQTKSATITLKRNLQRLSELASQSRPIEL